MPKKQSSGERNIIGHRIREARLKHKPIVSQEDLAGQLAKRGVYLDRSAISRMEQQCRFIRDYEIIAIAKALKIPVAWFFEKR